jgi:hypothetical protein
MKKKLVEARSRFTVLNTVQYRHLQVVECPKGYLYIFVTLCKGNRQPISASENGENFLDQIKEKYLVFEQTQT